MAVIKAKWDVQLFLSLQLNKTKDWALVQNAALVIDVKELKLG